MPAVGVEFHEEAEFFVPPYGALIVMERLPRAHALGYICFALRAPSGVPGGLGFPIISRYPRLKPWAIIFRARGARVVPVSPSTRVPQAEQQVPRLGPKPSLGMTVLATEANLGRGQGWNRLPASPALRDERA